MQVRVGHIAPTRVWANQPLSRNYGTETHHHLSKEHTMTSIKTTLNSALPVGAQGAYPNEYTSVLEALVNRDYSLTDQITDTVHREFGTDKDTVRAQLELAGMAVRPKPVPVVVAVAELVPDEAPAKKDKKSKKDKTSKLVRKLVKAARANGISI